MQSHPTSLHVHLVATACVFNLTTQDLAEAMPFSLISSTVTQLLHAMRTFPNNQQVRMESLCKLPEYYKKHILAQNGFVAPSCVTDDLIFAASGCRHSF